LTTVPVYPIYNKRKKNMYDNMLNEKFDEALVEGIFPTPIYFSYLKRPLSEEEEKLVIQSKKKTFKNVGNISSKDTYILETKPFKKLKKDLLLRVEHFFYNVLCYKDSKPYITQSWLNYTETNEHHHGHEHPNSIISGVFYIDADKKNDSILFKNTFYRQLQINIKDFNKWNSTSWWYPVETGKIVLFPSYLTHQVTSKKGNNTRISLAFNVFLKGALGNNQELTQLQL
tara:strand:- start:1536 stop:2222 length:687 start_codon:yes stop_codon:yes gene_type:complete